MQQQNLLDFADRLALIVATDGFVFAVAPNVNSSKKWGKLAHRTFIALKGF